MNGAGPECDEGFLPYRHLALHVLARALRDAVQTGGCAADREDARKFLASSQMLNHWCRVAALDPVRLSERAEALLRLQP